MEYLDIYDDFGNPTGRTIVRGDQSVKLDKNEHIAVAVVFIENKDGLFLIQKTSKEKGGKFSSTGGHVDHGESPLESIQREVEEELGISVLKEEFTSYGYLLYDMPIRYLFYLKKDINLSTVQLQKEEVDYVEYMSVEEILDLIQKQEMLESHGILFQELLKKRKETMK